jgi:tetratricopeptide (TPR) repeat protein
MLTSKEVFAKRKEGHTEEAYRMALELIQNNPNDEWNIRALAYSTIDMIKQAVKNNDFVRAKNFVIELENLSLDKNDEILMKSVHNVKQLADPQTKIISDAKALSKAGRHQEAAEAYRVALGRFPQNKMLADSLGWELYRIGKSMFSDEKIELYPAKRLLAEYIKLQNERPSLLHSLFLRFADRLLGNEGFNLIAFLKLWNLNNLTQEDYEPYTADNGKTYPSIAERIIQHAAKDALHKKNMEDVAYILPFVDTAIRKFPENFWLIYYKAKLLHLIGQNDAALSFSISVAKVKVNEYWAWALLAEILLDMDKEKAFSCYCKALLCKGEDKFLANVRIKFAELLIEKSLYPEAKYEIDKAIESREKEGWKLTEELIEYQNSDWYSNTVASENNHKLYTDNIRLAESLLFESMPWYDAVLGETFTLPKKPNKQKRKIYVAVEGKDAPLEISVSESQYDFRSISVGSGLKIKGEFNQEHRFQIYVIDQRVSLENWDIFKVHIGVVDHINSEKGIAHFIVNKEIDGILHFTEYPIKLKIGTLLALKLSVYENNKGVRYKVIDCKETNEKPENGILQDFDSLIRVSNGFGFTDEDIFIDRQLIDKYNIQDDDNVRGISILNYNQKKNTWGRKAITIDSVN